MIKSLIKNKYVFSLLSKFSIVGLGLLDTILINRYLGPQLKGEYVYVLNIANMMSILLNLGVYQAYPYFKRKKITNLCDRFFSIMFVQFMVFSMSAFFVALTLENKVYSAITILIPIAIFAKQLSQITMIEKINLRNLINMLNQSLFTLGLVLVYLISSKSVLAIIYLSILKEFMLILWLIRSYKLVFKPAYLDLELFIDSIKFGWMPLLTLFLLKINYRIDVILLRYFVEYKEIGYYSVGASLAGKVWIIPDAFKDVLLSKAARKDSIDDILISLKINLYISLLLFLPLYLWGEGIIELLYGSDFMDSYKVSLVIFIGIVPMLYYKLINPLFISRGKRDVAFRVLLIAAITNVALNWCLIPWLGIIGAALASVCSYSICGFLYIYIFMKEFSIEVSDLFVLKKHEIDRIVGVFVNR